VVVGETYLVLVGGVERDLADFAVAFPHVPRAPAAQLDALEQRGLGRVARRISLGGGGKGKHI